ncbi:hypothetical protein [Butyrivibrio sp. FCS014]|uniref:hypothetical protein n=1 Tax=Butyrivibrio sp. FCS014 TaxID=1408304 RepID=UPI000463B748|nr:hypothetical protein [Butyrivibrio sp. FCS014]
MNYEVSVKDTITDFGKKTPFASFLPGIAGIKGTPIWCYYVNRGQAVVSFGVQDKDHSIMEFYPAHTAYQNVNRTGFRTFIKANGAVYEPFQKPAAGSSMEIHMNALFLEEKNGELGLSTKVSYTTLPGEEIGALMRVVTITNESGKDMALEVIDGMPALIPYGCHIDVMKNMVQTTKAYMQVEDHEEKRPYFRVRFSMEDSAVVKKVPGGNFGVAVNAKGEKLAAIVDPGVVFDYDLSLSEAIGFENAKLSGLLAKKQNNSNEFPCCFFGQEANLGNGESITFFELIGQVRNKEILDNFLKKDINAAYFEEKFAEAEKLTDELTDTVATETSDKTFDDYTRYNYMDNVLRGGTPIKLPGDHTFYVYSRKHGDLERDYNYFAMSPEFYSQGNGNFRDVNQNRRCDNFFSPIVMDENIKRFYSLIQMDGYNPLGIEQIKFTAPESALSGIELAQPFTPGQLISAIKDSKKGISDAELDETFAKVMESACETINGNFGEGYWSDHWDYNLDLIDDFLEVYPDKEKELLLDTMVGSFEAKVKILPRAKKYEETENGLRQYHYLTARDNAAKGGSYELSKDGSQINVTLISKLFLMSAVKFAALDAEGMGVEMEGGKPGWYDALNGMPGMFGSSMNETYELLRMIRYTRDSIRKFGAGVELPAETVEFAKKLADIEGSFTTDLDAWNKRNDAKEEYRALVYDKLSGDMKTLDTEEAAAILDLFAKRIENGISKAFDLGDGIAPAYFTYEVTDFDKDEEGIYPKKFEVRKVPFFLEGPVRFLKLENTEDEKRKLYERVKGSDLYDKKLSMYKVNASLENASFELGRCKSFTPGWLENESIWLHMEYKYLLELIRSGLYKEFFEDFKKAAVPFLDKEVYGRSTLENSSFIASSFNPNEQIHGKGFVARLSGSTIEFISMWKLMFFGRQLFSLKDGELVFEPQPAIPEYLIKEEGGKCFVSSTMLGKTKVTYEFNKKGDFFPGGYSITGMTLKYADGREQNVSGSTASGDTAKDIRDGLVKEITVAIA